MTKFPRIAAFVIFLFAGHAIVSAQSNFDNGQLSFTVPQGWHTETNPARPSDVRVKADKGVAFILITFSRGLSTYTDRLKIEMQDQALVEVSAFFSPGMNLKPTQNCDFQEGSLAGQTAIACFTPVRDAQNYPAIVRSIGIPLSNMTCLLSEFSSGYEDDFNSLQAGASVVEDSLHFLNKTSWDIPIPTRPLPGSSIFRNSLRSVAFNPPSNWRLSYSDQNEFVYRGGSTTYIVYFGSFSDLLPIISSPNSPWTAKISGPTHFTATAGSYFMEVTGLGRYTKILLAPIAEIDLSMPAYRSLETYLSWDPLPAPQRSATPVNTSNAPVDAGGCPGCAQSIMSHMSAMTSITGSGW